MVFRDESIKIEKPIYIVRFNSPGGLSPYKYQKWYLTAKSVEDENGIYGVPFDDLLTNGFYEMGIQNPENDVLLLETSSEFWISSEKRKFDINDVYEKLNIRDSEKPKWVLMERLMERCLLQEMVFSKANILHVVKGDNIGQLKKLFTDFILCK